MGFDARGYETLPMLAGGERSEVVPLPLGASSFARRGSRPATIPLTPVWRSVDRLWNDPDRTCSSGHRSAHREPRRGASSRSTTARIFRSWFIEAGEERRAVTEG